MQANLIGYYSDAEQPIDQPTYDPPHDAPCPHCGSPITPVDVRTISLMYAGGAARAYFYRVHRTCDEMADESARLAVDGQAFEAVEAMPPDVR